MMSDRLPNAMAQLASYTQSSASTPRKATRETGGDAFTVEVRGTVATNEA